MRTFGSSTFRPKLTISIRPGGFQTNGHVNTRIDFVFEPLACSSLLFCTCIHSHLDFPLAPSPSRDVIMWPRRTLLSTPRWTNFRTLWSSRDSRIARRPARRNLPLTNCNASARFSSNRLDDSSKPGADRPSGASHGQSRFEELSSTLHDTNPRNNSLLAPVNIPDDSSGVLKDGHPATSILASSGLVVQRQLEMMNVLL